MKKKIIILSSIIIGLCLVMGSIYYYQSKPTQNLKVIFFDVGQGDSVFIETSTKYQILIDGGDNNKVIYKLGQYMPFYDREIDLVIVSHPHDDHLVGLVEVLRRYKVKQIMITDVDYYTPAYDSFLKEVKEQNIKVIITAKDQPINLEHSLSLEIIYPFEIVKSVKFENLNNSSIVMKLKFNQIKFLFSGDAEIEIEEEILLSGADLSADVLKAGHHGSDTSNSKEFVEAVKPQYFAIQVGAENKFGHPSLRVLNRLKRMGIKALRTDLDGDIIFFTDGEKVWQL